MAKYAIIDMANLFSRARFVTRGDLFDRTGLTMQIAFRAIRRLYQVDHCTHVVIALEGGSWRNTIYPTYKGKRRADRAEKMLDPKFREEEEAFNDTMRQLADFFRDETACTVLEGKGLEGDDLIARWVAVHPDDQHVIMTSDSDFVQLISDRVTIYDGIKEVYLNREGVFDINGNKQWFEVDGTSGKIKHSSLEDAIKKHNESEHKKKSKKETYEIKPFVWEPESEWYKKALFVKLIRGDISDSVFSAYPGVRYNGSANKIGINEAWEDRHNKTWAWNQFMNATWVKNGKTVTVKSEMDINKVLIDLTQHPQEINDKMDRIIVEAVTKDRPSQIGIRFMKFCGKHNLNALAKEAISHANYLNAPYGDK